MNSQKLDTHIPHLGPARIDSPSKHTKFRGKTLFVTDNQRICIDLDPEKHADAVQNGLPVPGFEMAGPREKIYFDPSKLRCAIVTCGGLCPGLNDIIRSVVLELTYGYGVKSIYGIRYGLQGFIPKYRHDVMDLAPESVVNIHNMGGSILGSSRGPQPVEEIVDCLERMSVGVLFMAGGDGTLHAAQSIADEIISRKLKIGVVSIPKTIDNDIYLVQRSFGFETAVAEATRAVRAAHNEARGYPNGIGLIKLMGRHSGFIAATTALSQQDVNFVLIPEVDFDLEGENGLLQALADRLKSRGHAVIVVAEGAGQKFFENIKDKYDPSGNIKLRDIGVYLRTEIKSWFDKKGTHVTIKYIDPSYTIRSLPANSGDNLFCSFLGRNAVHAAMAGKTKVLISRWNGQFVHVPVTESTGKRKKIDPDSRFWMNVLDATGQ